MSRIRHSVITVAGLFAVLSLVLACASGGGGGPKPGGGGNSGTGGASGSSGTGGGGEGGAPTGICLLNNCSSDDQCVGCSFGRDKCDVPNNRCVACDAKTGQGCATGEKCTSFGTCAPGDLTCPTDGQGQPTITCKTTPDCAACDPLHQVCVAGKCQACSPSDMQGCTGADVCKQGACVPKCPGSCTTNADCSTCDLGGKTAKYCENHVCVACTATAGCDPGLSCQKGQCVKPCGIPGGGTAPVGGCQQDAECYGCGNTEATEKWQCKLPVNSNQGTCVHPAAGCTDLGGAALPPPFNSVTNTCSKDADCANVTADFDVGKAIKDLIGSDKILGVKINNSVLKYPMKACASVELFDKKCGLCVPCKTDAECTPIDLDPIVTDLFKGDPLATIAAAFLMDQLFGKEKHQLHMQCQPVAAGYGVCVPCSNPTKGCGAGSGTTSNGNCDHDACTKGAALDPTCDLCTAAVCTVDQFCCRAGWDDLCIKLANTVCPVTCTGGAKCTHNPCKLGTPMNSVCSECVNAVCKESPLCCNALVGDWDQQCVDKANSLTECAKDCNAGGNCVHSECDEGAAMPASCSSCATDVCATDAYCCDQKWDVFCANKAKALQTCACN
ncbi:MAG: hypothetical protein R3B13_07830 [Polyangiaceae bacterium]